MSNTNSCPDCKGSGTYVGFHAKELCRTCDGMGVIGGGELEIAARKAVKKFGPDHIRQRLAPEYACLNLTASLGKIANLIKVDEIVYVFLRKKPGQYDAWVDWEGEYPLAKVLEFFAATPVYYAVYRRMALGNNLFERIAIQK